MRSKHLFGLAFVLWFAALGYGQTETPEPLIVATKLAEPFVMEGPEGPVGLSIDLWNAIAEDLGLSFEYRLTSLDDLIDGVATERYDAGIAAISVTPDRESVLDMTHGYYTDGLGIAVASGGARSPWLSVLNNFFTLGFLTAVGALTLLLMGVGIAMWLVERKRNTEEFRSRPTKGIGDGFWFAAVTMTTVGYGDKSPRTLPGRAMALVWMFASIIVISAFTGAIASSLTAAQISTGVRGPEDLRTARTGVLADSATVGILKDRGVSAKAFGSVQEGLEALADDQIDAFVHDWSILRYRVTEDHPGELWMLDSRFNVGSFAIALPPGSALREPINRAILEITRSPVWQRTVERYLGPTP